MFNFFSMALDYDSRKVARYPETGDFLVDTCRVTDSDRPYETAVKHSRYNDGKMVIVELYDSKEQAQAGHDAWVKRMTGNKLPASLKDVSTCGVVKLGLALGEDVRGTHRVKPARKPATKKPKTNSVRKAKKTI